MSTYLGNDLIIKDGDTAIAAAKSCTIDVKADTVEYSSPTQGRWRNYRAGQRSWTLTTNHLVRAATTAASPLREALARVGNAYTLTFTVRGQTADTFTGRAICTAWRITATRGSLVQGSFTWRGDGALE